MDEIVILFFVFFTIALVYSSVGFGGGSSYLAVLALSGLPFGEVRFTAMVCNIAVVLGNTALFSRSNWWDIRKYTPFILAGMPMAFAGATIPIREHTYFVLLGSTLLLASLLLWFQSGTIEEVSERKEKRWNVNSWLAGGSIGFLSGMAGIGGGIFLSPLLFFLRWDTARHIAAVSSLYILANSVSGLAGQIISGKGAFDTYRLMALTIAVTAGGQAGARSSLRWFSPIWVRRITAVLVFGAGTEILFKYLH